jgi:hypothetical protein
MRKMLALVMLAVFLSFGLSTMSFAQSNLGGPGGEGEAFETQLAMAKAMAFEGTVVSHDVMCHCVVVKTAMGNLTLQDDYAKFQQDYNRLKGLKVGSMVKGEYKTVNFINYAMWVSYK